MQEPSAQNGRQWRGHRSRVGVGTGAAHEGQVAEGPREVADAGVVEVAPVESHEAEVPQGVGVLHQPMLVEGLRRAAHNNIF